MIAWLLLGIQSFAFGLLLVQYLVVHPTRMSGYLLASCLMGGAAVLHIATAFGAAWPLATGLALAAALAGYAVMAWRVLSRQDESILPPITRSRGDRGAGHRAVIYFTHGEPPLYDPQGWINQFQEFDRDGIPFVPTLARPLFLNNLRQHYLVVGRSDHREMHRRMLASLAQAYRRRGDTTTRFYLSFLDDTPRPDAAVIQALNDGAIELVLAEVFLTDSNHTAEGRELVEKLPLADYGVTLRHTAPLWNSPTLQCMFVERANAALGDTPKAQVGVMLVGHGQPAEWDREFATETEQEIAFRQSILDQLAADGFCREYLGMAWMEFRRPQPAALAERWARDGVQRILYFAAAISAEAMHSQYDIPALFAQASLPATIPLVNLGAWNAHPLTIQAIQERIDAALGTQPT